MLCWLRISWFCQFVMASPFLPCEGTSLCAWVPTPARRPQFTRIVPAPLCLVTWTFLWQMARWRAKTCTLDTSPENMSLLWDKVTWSSENTVVYSRATFPIHTPVHNWPHYFVLHLTWFSHISQWVKSLSVSVCVTETKPSTRWSRLSFLDHCTNGKVLRSLSKSLGFWYLNN